MGRYFKSYNEFLSFSKDNNINNELGYNNQIYHEIDKKVIDLINKKGILNITQPNYGIILFLFKDMTYVKYSRHFDTVNERYDSFHNEHYSDGDDFVYKFEDIDLEDLYFLSIDDYNEIKKEYIKIKEEKKKEEEFEKYLELKKKFEQ